MINRKILFLLILLVTFSIGAAQCSTIYVKPTGDDANAGTSWELAKKTVQAGLNAVTSGDEVWVAKGTYVECITLKSGVALYGGFIGNETALEQRNWKANETVFDANQAGSVIIVPTGATIDTRVDGFKITNGNWPKTSSPMGSGVYCSNSAITLCNNNITKNKGEAVYIYWSSSAVLSNNTISGNLGIGVDIQYTNGLISDNTFSANTIGILCRGWPYRIDIRHNIVCGNTEGGINLDSISLISNNYIYNNGGPGIVCNSSAPEILNNVIVGNTRLGSSNPFASNGGGITCNNSSPIISGNIIAANRVMQGCGGGIFAIDAAAPTVTNNVIIGNYAATGGGLYFAYQRSTMPVSVIANNMVVGNVAADSKATPGTVGHGGGMYFCSQQPLNIINNTVVGNSAIGDGGGLFIALDNKSLFANNIVSNNSSGVYFYQDVSFPLFRNNNVFNPSGSNYALYNNAPIDYNGTNGNISIDPRFLNYDSGQLHLVVASPCIDAGDNTPLQDTWTDIDGQSRKLDGNNDQIANVDIGADEYDETTPSMAPVIIRVSPDGDDSNDGFCWTLAKKTIQAGLIAAVQRTGEVWVKAGTYQEKITLLPAVKLYGGFNGTETERSQRNWKANVTIIDGQGAGTVVTALAKSFGGVIDGFTITNGKAIGSSVVPALTSEGAAILLLSSDLTISNNTITGNTADASNTGIIYCNRSTPTITNNLIVKNSLANAYTSNKAVIFATTSSNAVISNNTIADNDGKNCCIVYGYLSFPIISNNVFAFNPRGLVVPTQSIRKNNCHFNTLNSGYIAGSGDFIADPLFVNHTNGDYHFLPNSPCINNGWNDATALPLFDLDHKGRIFGGTVDMGAYEFWPDTLSPADAKVAADGAVISGNGSVVTAAFPDYFYVETENRSSGIRVDKVGYSAFEGSKVSMNGKMATTSDGERCILADTVSADGTDTVKPLGISAGKLGGGKIGYQNAVWGWQMALNPSSGKLEKVWKEMSGLNNIGLLVRTWGKAVKEGTECFVTDGSGDKVRLILPSGVSVDENWRYISVTGISSCEKVDGGLVRVLRVRNQEDIQQIN